MSIALGDIPNELYKHFLPIMTPASLWTEQWQVSYPAVYKAMLKDPGQKHCPEPMMESAREWVAKESDGFTMDWMEAVLQTDFSPRRFPDVVDLRHPWRQASEKLNIYLYVLSRRWPHPAKNYEQENTIGQDILRVLHHSGFKLILDPTVLAKQRAAETE